ncbi:MAG: hypothetical protein EBZ17_14315, partial [Actinobacteria bacterium]|nr:hypothetical protein [Actinomycetota bacterium]
RHAIDLRLDASLPNKHEVGGLERLTEQLDDRREATFGAHALGIALGCRILRAHDVRGNRRLADTMSAVLQARRDNRYALPEVG